MTPAESADGAPLRRPRAQRPQLFGPGDLMWELQGQRLLAATSGGAFLLQVMHPAIGAVVDRESVYRTDTWGRAARSFASVQTWIYGGPEAVAESRRLRQMHRGLAAVDEHGREFHALAPQPWAWVPLTAYQATLEYCRRFAPEALGPGDEWRLYQEVLRLCRLLQVPARMLPADPDAYWTYLDHMIDEVLENHPTAHNLLAVIDSGPCPPWLPAPLRLLWRPLGSAAAANVTRLVTVGALPERARDKLGLSWRRSDELELRAVGRVLGEANARLPERLKYLPIAYRARAAARATQRLQEALAARPR
jgi:uncharacterized protein (DUF2236 family)